MAAARCTIMCQMHKFTAFPRAATFSPYGSPSLFAPWPFSSLKQKIKSFFLLIHSISQKACLGPCG